MMIQPIGILQTHSVLANSSPEARTLSSGVPGKVVEPKGEVDQESPSLGTTNSDSIEISAAGISAFANRVLRENSLAELNKILQASDEGATPIEELDPTEHTPEKTADFIVSLTTRFYDTYAAGHPELDSQGVLDGFMEVISGGIQKGFDDAREVLEGLELLKDSIAEGVDKTDSLVSEGLKQFYEHKLALMEESEEILANAA
jgi:hypothetical protein